MAGGIASGGVPFMAGAGIVPPYGLIEYGAAGCGIVGYGLLIIGLGEYTAAPLPAQP